MSTMEMVGFDLFIRHTDTDGNSVVRMHRVWDKERFIAARQDEAASENAKVKGDKPRKARADHITEDQYKKERK